LLRAVGRVVGLVEIDDPAGVRVEPLAMAR
jgi:hypothetical protein